VLHILVGGAWQPVISVILLLNPRKTYLWCSKQTKEKGKIIRDVLMSENLNLDICMMDSHDLSQAYDTFYEKIRTDADKEVLVCNTGGNRLMGTAALLAASQAHKKVVYRDVDSDLYELVLIYQNELGNWCSGGVKIENLPERFSSRRINWGWLFGVKNTKSILIQNEIQSADDLRNVLLYTHE